MARFARPILLVLAASLALFTSAVASGIDPESNTDSFDPAAESHRIGEARRVNAIARQLDLIYRLQWENPYFPGEPPVRQPVGYESKQVAPNRWIYRPLYAEDVAGETESGAEPLPEPTPQRAPQAAPQAPAPADAQPGDFMPPKNPAPPARRGPREF
jgi:hypothetical protein